MGTTAELELLMGEQSEDAAEESAVRVKGRAGRKPGRVMPGQRGYRKPFTKEAVRATETRNVAQPWETDASLLPRKPPGRK